MEDMLDHHGFCELDIVDFTFGFIMILPMKAAMREVGADVIPSAQKPWDYLPEDNLSLLPGQVDYRNYTFESERAREGEESESRVKRE